MTSISSIALLSDQNIEHESTDYSHDFQDISLDLSGVAGDWQSLYDPTHRLYWINIATNQSQWQDPYSETFQNYYPTELSPSIDAATPYPLEFTTPITQPEQLWYVDDPNPPQSLVDETNTKSSLFWALKSKTIFDSINTQLTDASISHVPHRTGDDEPQLQVLRKTFCQVLSQMILQQRLLFIISMVLWCYTPLFILSLCGFIFRLHWFRFSHHFYAVLLSGFVVIYAVYVVLFVLPSGGCCLSWYLRFGWSGPVIQHDIVATLKQRKLGSGSTPKDVFERLQLFERNIPTMHLYSQAYHFASEDTQAAQHAAEAPNQSDWLESWPVPRSFHPGFNNSNDTGLPSDGPEPILLSYQAKRLATILRHRDISIPAHEWCQHAFAQMPFDVVRVRYSARFELPRAEVPLLDAVLREFYFQSFTKDLHCLTSCHYQLSPQLHEYVAPDYEDVVFPNQCDPLEGASSGKSQGSALFKLIFHYDFTFFIAIWAGLYLFALVVWEASSIQVTYHNVKHLHLAPTETINQFGKKHLPDSAVGDVTEDDSEECLFSTRGGASSSVKYSLLDIVNCSGPRSRQNRGFSIVPRRSSLLGGVTSGLYSVGSTILQTPLNIAHTLTNVTSPYSE